MFKQTDKYCYDIHGDILYWHSALFSYLSDNLRQKFSDNQYLLTKISEKNQFLVLIRRDFRINCDVNSDLFWIRAKFRENNKFYSESEDDSEWITELALNQTNSVQNVTWNRLWLVRDYTQKQTLVIKKMSYLSIWNRIRYSWINKEREVDVAIISINEG